MLSFKASFHSSLSPSSVAQSAAISSDFFYIIWCVSGLDLKFERFLKCSKTNDCCPSNKDFGKMTHSGLPCAHGFQFRVWEAGWAMGCGFQVQTPFQLLEVVAAQSGDALSGRICLPLCLPALRISHVISRPVSSFAPQQRTSKVCLLLV